MKKITSFWTVLLFLCPMIIFCCTDDEYKVPKGNTALFNDCIKRTVGPNMVGLNLEFAYAMALGPEKGKLISAQVEASIAGAPETYLEHRSFYTNMSGVDIPITVGEPSTTNAAITKVIFTSDTCAATLRYYYRIPEEARGKSVSFTFSAEASTGEKVSFKSDSYEVAKMDMQLDIVLSDNDKCYLSVADMTAYNAAEAASNSAKIDLVYLYRAITGISFNHALVSPSNTEYLPEVTLPAGVSNRTSYWKVWGLRDRHLARLQYGVYVDDLDFQKMDFTGAPDYGLDMKLESGAWVETSDRKYRAYIYVNNVNNSTREMTVSIKRYPLN